MKNKFILFLATPTKLQLRYKNKKGQIKNYLRVTPIEVFPDGFIGYVFGQGIKRFNNDNIIEIYDDTN